MFKGTIPRQQSDAVEACWAHNPEVRGSKKNDAKGDKRGRMRETEISIGYIYLLLTEFEGRTVSSGTSFFLFDLWPKREARGP